MNWAALIPAFVKIVEAIVSSSDPKEAAERLAEEAVRRQVFEASMRKVKP